MARKFDNSILQWCGLDIPSKTKLATPAAIELTNETNKAIIETDTLYPNLSTPSTKPHNSTTHEETEIEGFLKSLNSLKTTCSTYDAGSNLNHSSLLFSDFLANADCTNENLTQATKSNSSKNPINAGIEPNPFDSFANKWNSYYEGAKQELTSSKKPLQGKMSGPPHPSHGRQAPSPNTAWNHLQVPNYFPRQPQVAHMSNDHPILHQPTWHTPTTEPVNKSIPHSHLFNLEQMITERERTYPKPSPGVDLTLQRNGSQNGELPTTPISLSVRDANKINSLPASAIDVQGTEIKSLSPHLKSVSPGLKVNPLGGKSTSPGLGDKNVKRSTKKMDQILERLNPSIDKNDKLDKSAEQEKTAHSSVIVQSSSMHDENSNSNSILSTATVSNACEEDVVSPFSNDDSMDSNKSRRKRKPSKTMRVSKDTPAENDRVKPEKELKDFEEKSNPEMERRRSGSAPPGSPTLPSRQRRKTSSESETIDNIAAMIQSTECDKSTEDLLDNSSPKTNPVEPSTQVSVIINKEVVESPSDSKPKKAIVFQTPAQKKITDPNSFVEVETKLEEMFAGIPDDVVDLSAIPFTDKVLDLDDSKDINESKAASQIDDSVTSTFSDINVSAGQQNKKKSTKSAKRQNLNDANESYSKKKKSNKKSKSVENSPTKSKANPKKSKNISKLTTKTDLIKDIYAYDSGSNASSSRSKGPFVQIKGSRDSPISVNIVNTPTNEDETDKKPSKSKKYHDDTEYRHKVRSRGLHCSTLSNKYDSQTRDASWICVFCKRGPHATDPHLSGPSRFSVTTIIPAPGDLFGPYIITTDSPEYQRRLDDPYDQQFKSKKVARAVIASSKPVNKKIKRKLSDSYDSRSSLEGADSVDIYLGITETRDKVYEVWAHEDCIVWSPGVYLIGPKIVGLEEAVWTSCNVVCSRCRYKGANICCVKRGCINVAHFGCAAALDWFLDEDNYKALCTLHKQ